MLLKVPLEIPNTRGQAMLYQESLGMHIDSSTIRQSFKHIIGSSDALVARCFDLLVKLHPSMKNFLKAAPEKEVTSQITNVLIFVVDHLDDKEKAKSYLNRIGKKLQSYDLRGQQYGYIKDVLLRGLAGHLNEKWTPKTAEHWGLVCDFTLQAIMEGAEVPLQSASWLSQCKQEKSECLTQMTQHTSSDSKAHLADDSQPICPVSTMNLSGESGESGKPKDKEAPASACFSDSVNSDSAPLPAKAAENARNPATFELILKPSSEQLSRIRRSAASYAQELVSKYWEQAFYEELCHQLEALERQCEEDTESDLTTNSRVA